MKYDTTKILNVLVLIAFGLSIFWQTTREPVKEVVVQVVKEVEIEYVPVEVIVEPKKPTIDPKKIPDTPKWALKNEDARSLIKHLISETEPHKVPAYLIEGWSLDELRRLHSYLHNGHKLEDLYE